MRYKAVFCDLDGTLLNSRHEISAANKASIQRIRQKGVPFIICSGRSYESLREYEQILSEGFANHSAQQRYISAFNGGFIVQGDDAQVIHAAQLQKAMVQPIIKAIRGFAGLDIIAYYDPRCTFVERDTPATRRYAAVAALPHHIVEDLLSALPDDFPKMMAIGAYEELERMKQAVTPLLGQHINMFNSTENMVEFTASDATKGKALLFLSAKLGIDPSEVIAIGDNQNDISMLQQAGLPVAVANATEELKTYAKYITVTNHNESAVAEVLEKFVP